MSNFNNYKKFENIGIRSSNDTLIVMDSSNNNISLHSSDGGDDNVDTLSIKNIINKTPNMDLNLSSLNGTIINPVITINNNHSDCRIMTNLNVAGNVNITENLNTINTIVSHNLIIPTHNNSNLLSNVQGSIYYNTSENMYEGYVGNSEGWQPLGGFSKTKDATIHKNLNVLQNINCTDKITSNINQVSHNLIIPTHTSTESSLLSNVQGSIYFNTSEKMYEGYVGNGEGEGWQPLGGFSKTKDATIHKNLNVLQNINCTDKITSNINQVSHNLIIPTHTSTESSLLSNVQGSIYFNTSEKMYEGYVGNGEGEGWQPLGGFSKTKDATIHKNLNVLQNINCTDKITSNINLVSHNLIIPTHNNSNLLSNVQGSIYFNTSENMYEGYVGNGEDWQPLSGFSKTKDAVIHKNLNVLSNVNINNNLNVEGIIGIGTNITHLSSQVTIKQGTIFGINLNYQENVQPSGALTIAKKHTVNNGISNINDGGGNNNCILSLISDFGTDTSSSHLGGSIQFTTQAENSSFGHGQAYAGIYGGRARGYENYNGELIFYTSNVNSGATDNYHTSTGIGKVLNPVMTITGDKRVGIGQTNPTKALDVNGDIKCSSITSSDLIASRALISNSNGKVAVSTVTTDELNNLSNISQSADGNSLVKRTSNGDIFCKKICTYPVEIFILLLLDYGCIPIRYILEILLQQMY